MTTPAASYYPYSDPVETVGNNEEQTFDEIAATMRRIAQTIGDRARHAARPVHAKSHGPSGSADWRAHRPVADLACA